MKYLYQLILSLGCVMLGLSSVQAQQNRDTSVWVKAPQIDFTGFLDVFYVYDFNRPEDGKRQSFFFNHNRHNEFNVNLGLLKIGVKHKKYRMNLAMQVGTYANDNYAAEPGLLKNIFEANLGIALNRKNTIWIDAGILPSHIGFESAISINNPTLTRSLLAESSPFFETGVKLTFYPTPKWELAVLVLNGWQRIRRPTANTLPAFGTQLLAKPNSKITLNWSTFIGSEYPDSTRRMRLFNNLFAQWQVTPKIAFTFGLDIGLEQKNKGSVAYNYWWTPVLIGQYQINANWKTALRIEYYHDSSEIIISTPNRTGFETLGVSLNIDYIPIKNIMCRLEARWLQSRQPIFDIRDSSRLSNNNIFIGVSIAARFDARVL